MGLSNDRLLKLARSLEDDEADMFIEWVLDGIKDIGFMHSENCALFRPHSHSADCDCIGEKTGFKINRILNGE